MSGRLRSTGSTLYDQPMPSLVCDEAGCPSECGGTGSLAALREWAASTGWTSQDGRDYCPRHRDAP